MIHENINKISKLNNIENINYKYIIYLSTFTFFLLSIITFVDVLGKNTTDSTDEVWLKEFWKYWINVPIEKTIESGNQCLINIPKNKDLPIMVLNPFHMGEVKQNCVLPSGREIMIPAYVGECDTGDKNNERASPSELLICALDSDAGKLTFQVFLDDKIIIDTVTKVGDNIQSPNFIEIKTTTPFNVTVPENSQYFGSAYDKSGTYLAQAHGFLGKIDKLQSGNHKLKYTVEVFGTRGLDNKGGWDFKSTVLYDLIVK